MITVYSDNKEIKTNYTVFSDGALTYRLQDLPESPRYISINVDPSTPVRDVREEVGMVYDCLIEKYGLSSVGLDCSNVELHLPYLPYGRADRVFEEGNPHALNNFLFWLGDLGFDKVHVCDPHNEGILEGCSVNWSIKSQLECFKNSIPHDFDEYYDFVVAPDKGAVNKAQTIATHLETDIIFASKKRDISTGRITSIELPKVNLVGAKVFIPDDLCDFGGTFIGLAKALKDAGAVQVDLYVTHLIAAKGLKCLQPHIDKLYCFQTIGTYVNEQNVLDYNLGNYVK